jgi:A/G-specific adenine glycosylase
MTINEVRVTAAIEMKKREFIRQLRKWTFSNFKPYPWRQTSDPYHILISELLLRRTRAQNVLPVYKDFVMKFPTIKDLEKASKSDIANVIESLGIRSRALLICSVARNIVRNHPKGFPSNEEELIKVLGNSRYTVNAIRCFAFGERVPIFDVNVKRIIERVFSIDFGSDAHKKGISWKIASHLVPETDVKSYNWALLDLGREVCTPNNPKCTVCPLSSLCDYYRRSRNRPSLLN